MYDQGGKGQGYHQPLASAPPAPQYQQQYQQPPAQQQGVYPPPQQHYQQPPPAAQPYYQQTAAAPSGNGNMADPLVVNSAGTRFAPPAKYRDLASAIAFVVHIVAVIAIAAVYIDKMRKGEEKIGVDDGDSGLERVFGSRYTQIGIGSLFVGSLFGVFWLQAMKIWPRELIWTTLILGPVWTGAGVGVALYYGAWAAGIILLIVLLIQILYVFVVRRRIPFAVAMLRLVSRLVQDHPATVVVAIVALLPAILWCVLLVSGLYSVYRVYDLNHTRDESPYEDGETDGLTVLFVFSLYWFIGVCKNVVHVTCCGAFAAWYFGVPGASRVSSALRRSMSTSFGSVCLASLIVAILQTIRFLVNAGRHSSRNNLARCIFDCILRCIEDLMRLFSKYALSYVAIYGYSFVEASKRTWELFKNSGFTGIVNDSMLGGVVAFGAILGGVFTGAVAALAAYYMDNTQWLPAALIGFFVGLSMAFVALEPVASGTACMFVCFAESPRDLFNVDPASANEISAAWQERYGTAFVPVA